MSGVKDRVALVTGAGSPEGIGFATARLLYSAGAKIAITSTTDRINERRDEIERIALNVSQGLQTLLIVRQLIL